MTAVAAANVAPMLNQRLPGAEEEEGDDRGRISTGSALEHEFVAMLIAILVVMRDARERSGKASLASSYLASSFNAQA